MFRTFLKYFLSMMVCAFIGFATASLFLRRAVEQNQSETQVRLHVNIRGQKGQPVVGARLQIFGSSIKNLGVTDEKGAFIGDVLLPSGKIAILQAQGSLYRIRKNLLIPTSPTTTLRVLLDPAEAQSGHMRLLSKGTQELTRINARLNQKAVRKAQPPDSSTIALELDSSTIALELDSSTLASNPATAALMPVIKMALQAQNEPLRKRGVRVLSIRTLWADSPFFEIIAYNHSRQVVGGFLLGRTRTSEKAVTYALKNILPKSPAIDSSTSKLPTGKLFVSSRQTGGVRAYVNGHPLGRIGFGATSVFVMTKPYRTKKSAVTLAVTADDRPLVRKAIPTKELSRTLRWTLPEPILSRR